jgi:hypothetical protein
MKSEKTLASGNVARWRREVGLSNIGAIIVELDRPASEADDIEVRALLEELRPPGARTIERGSAEEHEVQAAKARTDYILRGGASN